MRACVAGGDPCHRGDGRVAFPAGKYGKVIYEAVCGKE